MLKLSLIIFYSIIFSINVHAANWNQNKQTKLPSLPESIINNFTPNQKIISSIDDREYSFCSLENLDWTGRDIYKVDKFLQKYSDYFNSDYVSVFKDTETGKLVEGKEVYGSFEDGLIKYTFALQGQHHNCLFNQNNASCQKLIDITSQLSKKKAATSPSASIKDTEIPFTTIQKMLIPTIIGYSSAVQVLGKPENHIEILKMSIAQNAYMLNKKFSNWKLARSKTEVAFLLKEGVNCIWCPSDLFKFSKKDIILKKEFALSMACKLSRCLLMQKVYLCEQEKLSDVLIEIMKNQGLTIEYCLQ